MVRGLARRLAPAAAVFAVAAAFVANGFGQPDDPADATKTFVGDIKGAPESARVAVVIDGDKFVAYVCSGDQAFNDTYSRWFRGTVAGGKLAAKSPCGAEFAAELAGDAVTGTLKKDATTHAFTATAVQAGGNAGLFRAGEAFGDDDYVIGWIVDEKEAVVGTGGKVGGKVQTLQAPKGNGNLNPVVGGKKLDPSKVGAGNGVLPQTAGKTGKTDPPAKAGTAKAGAKGQRLDAAAKAELLQDLLAARKASGGDAIQAMLIHQIRRFTTGKRPETKIEEKTFAVLRTAPIQSLNDYIKNWDKLPKTTRDTLLGPAAAQLNPNAGLAEGTARTLVNQQVARRGVGKTAPAKTATGTIAGVRFGQIRCIDETNPEVLGSDEVFAIHTVIVGNGEPQIKRTGLVNGFDDGVVKAIPAADAGVFPLAGQSPVPDAEVMVITSLFEDDGSGLEPVFNILRPLIGTAVVLAVEALNGDAKTLTELQKTAIRVAVDSAIGALEGPLSELLTQQLGSDVIVVRPNGQIVSETGAPKSTLRFRKVKNGDVRFDYEISGITVQR